MKSHKIINGLYDQYKNYPKKLKIVCDWDEVIQPHESWIWYLLITSKEFKHVFPNAGDDGFEGDFQNFWCLYDEDYVNELREKKELNSLIEYSPYGSKIKESFFGLDEDFKKKYLEIKNSPDLYQKAPFLTIAEDLLKLIKEGKVDRLIFLSAYDKRKFSYGDERKEQIFKETFDKVGYPHEKQKDSTVLPCYLELIPFDSETRKKTKAQERLDELLKKYTAFITFKENDSLVEKVYQTQLLINNKIVNLKEEDKQELEKLKKEVLEEEDEQSKNTWIKKNAWDYDIFIDDNPKICEEMVKYGNQKTEYCFSCKMEVARSRLKTPNNILSCANCLRSVVIAPYYPAVADQHNDGVLLTKIDNVDNFYGISKITKENFKK